MARRNRRYPYSRAERSSLANKETRGGRVLKAFRLINRDDHSLMAGCLSELVEDNTIPPIKTTTRREVFVFDPRLMPRNFNEAFLSGYQFRQVVGGIGSMGLEGYSVGLGRVHLEKSKRRTLLIDIDSERLLNERRGIYSQLGIAGVKGFTEDGKRSGHRIVKPPAIAVGNFAQPVSREAEEEIAEAVTTSLAVCLAMTGDEEIGLGKLQVKAYQPQS